MYIKSATRAILYGGLSFLIVLTTGRNFAASLICFAILFAIGCVIFPLIAVEPKKERPQVTFRGLGTARAAPVIVENRNRRRGLLIILLGLAFVFIVSFGVVLS